MMVGVKGVKALHPFVQLQEKEKIHVEFSHEELYDFYRKVSALLRGVLY